MFESIKNFFKKFFKVKETSLLKEAEEVHSNNLQTSSFKESIKTDFEKDEELESLIAKIKEDNKFIYSLSQNQLDRLDNYFDLKVNWIQSQIDINNAEISILENKLKFQKVDNNQI